MVAATVPETVNWWASPDWWVAVGTLALAGLTLVLWLSERAGRKREALARDAEATDRRAADAERREEAKARLIAQQHVEQLQEEMATSARREQAEQVYATAYFNHDIACGVVLHNDSRGPVHAVTGYLWECHAWATPVVRWERILSPFSVLQVLPGTPHEIRVDPAQGRRIDPNSGNAFVEIHFRDNGGRWWHRGREGHLDGPYDTEEEVFGLEQQTIT